VALQPVTYRPITPIKPVARKADSETARKAAGERKGPRRGRALEPGQGENLDTWV
jgi:hypothetical protein